MILVPIMITVNKRQKLIIFKYQQKSKYFIYLINVFVENKKMIIQNLNQKLTWQY
jgi:hypothetical protein